MNIAVWMASEKGANPAYVKAAETLGTAIAGRGHALVFGASQGGLMEAVSEACLHAGGEVHGVTVAVPFIAERANDHLTTCELTPDMSTRKARMIELSDAFIALPGGPGTLDELSEALMLLRIGKIAKPLVLLNVENFYAPLQTLFGRMIDDQLVDASVFSSVYFANTIDEALDFIEANAK